MVSLRGQTRISLRRPAIRMAKTVNNRVANTNHNNKNDPMDRPADPKSLIESGHLLEKQSSKLAEWLGSRGNVFCLTGAGISTESGIPDYRGHKGSYHTGHKPILHQQFITSLYQRKRYWGRSMVGWETFDRAKPNIGHVALANLERMGMLGVDMEDKLDFYDDDDRDEFYFTSGQRRLAILTQNVDSLHDRAGSKNVVALHGRNQSIRCVHCGHRMARNDYQEQLKERNRIWLNEHSIGPEDGKENIAVPVSNQRPQHSKSRMMRPDGDFQLDPKATYDEVDLPPCPCCDDGFFKPDVVFFGDSVPKHRVRISEEAVKHCDGMLVVGSSLAVHSAFRHVKAASQRGVSVAILNVGDTRAEAEGLDGLIKIEVPIGHALKQCVALLQNK